jgi:hypothetical protein
MKYRLSEVRKFSGYNLQDVLRFLKVDLSRGLQDLFAILNQKQKTQIFRQAVIRSGDMLGSGTTTPMLELTLPKGSFHIVGTCSFDDNGTSAATTIARIWITRDNGTTLPDEAIRGYNYNRLDLASGSAYDVPVMAQWLLELTAETTIYMMGRATYSGGSGAPNFQAAMVAHGYVME